jgi:hypothetical protein
MIIGNLGSVFLAVFWVQIHMDGIAGIGIILGYKMIFLNVEKVCCFYVIDAAIKIRYICVVCKVQFFYYTDYRTDWRGKGREVRGATPLACYVG